jgi:hypothetical protein
VERIGLNWPRTVSMWGFVRNGKSFSSDSSKLVEFVSKVEEKL